MYYIGYKGKSDEIENGDYWGSPSSESARENFSDPANRFTSILAYFDTENEGYVAETELQTHMDAAGDDNSHNGSNDAWKKGTNAREGLGWVKRVLTWFSNGASSEEKRTTVLNESQLNQLSNYIYNFNYYMPEEFSEKLVITEEQLIESTPETMELNLNKFLTQARQDCYSRGHKTGAYPSEINFEKELGVLRIELDGQLQARVFDLEQELVGLTALLGNLPAASKKHTDITITIAKLTHQIDYIKNQIAGDNFYNIIKSSFEKGYIERINEDQ